MAGNQASFFIKLLGDSKGAVSAIGKANTELLKQKGILGQVALGASNVSKTLKTGTDRIQGNAVAIAGGLFAAKKAFDSTIGVAGNFESAILKVQSVSGGAVEALSDLAREAGKATVFSATEAADALLLLAQAGLDAAESQDTLIPTLNLAAAAQIDLASATDMVVSNLTVFQEETANAGRFADVMAKTTSIANTNMEQLGAALEYAGPVASQVGISFEGLNTMIAAMATQGIKGEKAGTQLRAALTNIIKPTAQAEKVLEGLGISLDDIKKNINDPIKLFKLLKPVAQDTAAAVQVFGRRNLAVASAIKNATPQLIEFTKSLESAGGTAQSMADTQISGLEGQFKLLKSAFEEVILSGSKEGGLLDIFTSLVKFAIDVVRGFQRIPAPLKAVTMAVSILTPAVLALNAALGPVGLALGAVGAAMFLLIPKFMNMNDQGAKLGKITKSLISIQSEYKTVLEKLKDPTKNLTEAERILLNLRKQELEIKEAKALEELVRERQNLTSTIVQQRQEQEKLQNELNLINKRVREGEKLEKLIIKARKGNAEALKEIGEIVGTTRRKNALGARQQLTAEEMIGRAQERANKAAMGRAFIAEKLLKVNEKILNFNKIDTTVIDQLAQGYINYRDKLEGLRISREKLLTMSKQDQARIARQIRLIDERNKKLQETTDIINDQPLDLDPFNMLDRVNRVSLGVQELAARIKLFGIENIAAANKTDAAWQKTVEKLKGGAEKFEGVFGAVMGGVSNVFSSAQNFMTQKFANEQQRMNDEFERSQASQHAALTQRFEEGLISEEEYNEQKQAIDNAISVKREAAEKAMRIKQAKATRKAAAFQKGVNIANAIAGGALAVINTLALPIPRSVAIPLSAVVGALAAAQTAIIAATPLPEIPSYQQGGIKTKEGLALLAEGSKPEMILPADVTALLLEAAKLRGGGGNTIIQGLSISLPNVVDAESFVEGLNAFIRSGFKIPQKAIA